MVRCRSVIRLCETWQKGGFFNDEKIQMEVSIRDTCCGDPLLCCGAVNGKVALRFSLTL